MSELSKQEIKEKLGNIVQIRDLLLGDKIEEYDRNSLQTEKRLAELESKLANFQAATETRFLEMKRSMAEEIAILRDSLEKKLKYLSLTTHEETNKLQQNLTIANKKTSQQIEILQNSVNRQLSLVNNELSQTKEAVSTDLQNLKKQILQLLDEKASEIQEEKVGRSDLAEILFEICLKVKGSDFVPDLKEVSNNHVKTDFILPDEKREHN
jgi:hypothetical protein